MHNTTKLGVSSLGAYKPFVTEYKLSYKDPTPFIRKSGAKKSTESKKSSQSSFKAPEVPPFAIPVPSMKPDSFLAGGFLPTLPVGSNIVAVHQGKSHKDLWAPPPLPESANAVDVASTSLTLPGMMTNHPPSMKKFKRRRVLDPVERMVVGVPKPRYNILSGEEIHGEAYSGYKEGRRAVIQTFAHIDMTTNARTPGYNIISNRDYLIDDMEALTVA
ncbi:hypothetical protein BC830DRAFT_1170470 [Chytriomyces sp. MP71]|nr:hypothetical protein BC830DRAFT_1082848 [Chytriomyces sp. MP71]KAI8613186.1 hypothetical protein BC830DRAFT_1170470 [Chytriomyces sp. MP71]